MRIRPIKNNPPIAAVATPMGRSSGAIRVRAATSTHTRNTLPSKAETGRIIETVLQEEGRPPESIFDFVQGMTAHARSKAHQDTRLELEGKAKTLLEKAA